MLDMERLNELLVETGTIFDDVELIQWVGEGEWVVVFEDDALAISADTNEERLVLTATLCTLEAATTPEDEDADRVANLCKLLLTYNSLWRESGGLRTALDEPDGSLLLLLDVGVQGLDATSLAGILENFRKASTAWSGSILSAPDESEQATEGEEPSDIQVNAMRV